MGLEEHDLNAAGLPRIPLDLTQHKLSIALNWIPIVVSSCILPIAGYFALRYSTDLTLNTILSPWLGLMGVVSLFSLITRSWALLKKDSDCRPLGVERRNLDFFGWNFLLGFIAVTIFISLGIALGSLTVVSLPTSVLLIEVSLQLVLVPMLKAFGARAPMRFSSVARGDALRPGTYVIIEDVCAVDGEQGRRFRQAWSDRYEASPVMRAHLWRMDLVWGLSGLAVGAVIWGIVLGFDKTRVHREIGYALGWALPFIWAGVMTLVTISMTKSILRKEASGQRASENAYMGDA